MAFMKALAKRFLNFGDSVWVACAQKLSTDKLALLLRIKNQFVRKEKNNSFLESLIVVLV